MALGKQIKHYREKLGWKLEQLSLESGVEVGTISALENRDSSRSKFGAPIAKAFGLTVEQLLDESTSYEVGKGAQLDIAKKYEQASTAVKQAIDELVDLPQEDAEKLAAILKSIRATYASKS